MLLQIVLLLCQKAFIFLQTKWQREKKERKEIRSNWGIDNVRDIVWLKVRGRVTSPLSQTMELNIRWTAPLQHLDGVSTETWFNLSIQNESIGTVTGVHITTSQQEGLSLYHCECPWWSGRLSGTSKSGTRDRSQLVLLPQARSIYTDTSHLALLHCQRCHSQLCHLDTGLLRLLCYRIHREGVCCNYDLPVDKKNIAVSCKPKKCISWPKKEKCTEDMWTGLCLRAHFWLSYRFTSRRPVEMATLQPNPRTLKPRFPGGGGYSLIRA